MSKVYCEKTKKYINQDDRKKYSFTGETRKLGTTRCAVLKHADTKQTYLKPWDDFGFLVRKKGEANMYAKLDNKKVRTLVKDFYTSSLDEEQFKDKVESYARQYGVCNETILSVINGESWRHITVNYIKQLQAGNTKVVENVIAATNKVKGRNKLSPNLAKFMIRDHFINKVPVVDLSKKFLVSISTARRVIAGKAFKEVTVPALAEVSKWK
jgi:hypothetical protein